MALIFLLEGGGVGRLLSSTCRVEERVQDPCGTRQILFSIRVLNLTGAILQEGFGCTVVSLELVICGALPEVRSWLYARVSRSHTLK